MCSSDLGDADILWLFDMVGALKVRQHDSAHASILAHGPFLYVNTSNGVGGYLFSGYASTTQPYSQTPTGAAYQGDQGQRMLQVGSTRKMAISESGSAIFDAIGTGNGTFQTQAAATNTGAGIVSPGAVTDRSKLTGHDYAVNFAVSGTPAVTTYSVVDNSVSPAANVLQDQPYTAGASINFDGISFDEIGRAHV